MRKYKGTNTTKLKINDPIKISTTLDMIDSTSSFRLIPFVNVLLSLNALLIVSPLVIMKGTNENFIPI